MNGPTPRTPENRLLVLAPIGRDADLIVRMVEANAVPSRACRDLEDLAAELGRGAAAIALTEEALGEYENRLPGLIAQQPAWSDLPVLLLTRPGASSPLVERAHDALGNVTLLERPVRVTALVSAVRSAVRARARQYQTRKHLEEREQAGRRKDEFLAVLAHELRNPLAPIRNSIDILRMEPLNGAAPVIEIMDRQVTQMVRLIDDLMDVSRITRGKIELRLAPVDLGAVVRVAIETSRPLIDAAGHRLAIDIRDEPVPLRADPVRLAQVFSNLLNNAARYTDPGGHIALTARRDGDTAVVAVDDTGVGISPEALPNVFEMFAQADAHDSRAQSGLGIGLTLAKSLVEMHGGTIIASSDGPGRGSRFVVRLPIDESATSSAASAPQPADVRRELKILVVDDNQDAADTLSTLLRMLGAEVRVAYDGRSALELLAGFRPDAAVLDLGMPGMNGYELARRIRDLRGCEKVTLIALSGWGQEKDREATREAGFDHHLVKPVGLEEMQAMLALLGP